MIRDGLPIVQSALFANSELMTISAAGTAEESGAFDAGSTLMVIGLDGNISVGDTKTNAETGQIAQTKGNPIYWLLGSDETKVWVDVGTGGNTVSVVQIENKA